MGAYIQPKHAAQDVLVLLNMVLALLLCSCCPHESLNEDFPTTASKERQWQGNICGAETLTRKASDPRAAPPLSFLGPIGN